MLNGAHSMMAYTGFHSGHKYVHNVMSDEYLKVLIERHMNAASKTLDNISSIDYNKYANSLIEMFMYALGGMALMLSGGFLILRTQ